MLLLVLVAPPRVGVAVYPRVPGELIGAGEFLAAAWEVAGMRFLARVGPDVPRLVLKTVEGLLAQRALVRPWELIVDLSRLAGRQRTVGSEDGDGRHVAYRLVQLLGGRLRLAGTTAARALVVLGVRRLWVE